MSKNRILFVLLLMVTGIVCMAQTPATTPPALMTPDEIKWVPAPDALPAGAMFAVLDGDPGKEGAPFTVRLKMPDGYKIMPHWHPTTENVTVVSGDFIAGMGDSVDEKAAKDFPAGSFASMPANMHHYAWAKGPTVVQVHGMGPFQITYVNSADDPRNHKH